MAIFNVTNLPGIGGVPVSVFDNTFDYTFGSPALIISSFDVTFDITFN